MNTSLPECTSREADFRGWNACYLENGLVRLVAVPDIGGRIMAYDLGPYPYFFVDPDLAGKLFTAEENQGDGSLAAWKNYGGDKTWPAPQGWDNDQQWPGPPDPILDSGRYTVNEMSSDATRAVISMTSPPDPRTGVQITRHFTLHQGSSRVTIDLTFTNTQDAPIRWGIWDVVQLRAEQSQPDGTPALNRGCIVTAPLNPESKFPRGFNVMFGAEDNPQWQTDGDLLRAWYMWQIGKIGLDSTAGWIAFHNGMTGYGFVEQFTHDPDGEYPDDGATLEVWTVGAGEVGNLNYADSGIFLMETEVLGPLQEIAPGETASLKLSWGACRCPGPVEQVQAGGCLSSPLQVRPVADGFAQLAAWGGVFDAGTLRLIWLNDSGSPLRSEVLGAVNPLTLLQLDTVLPIPDGAAHLALVNKATANGKDRIVATAALTPAQE